MIQITWNSYYLEDIVFCKLYKVITYNFKSDNHQTFRNSNI